MRDAADIHPVEEERLPWPDGWDAARDPADAWRCRMMWCAVVSACVMSMLRAHLSPRAMDRPVRRSDPLHKDGPAVGPGWLGSRDFHMTCALAGLDGAAVEHRLRRAMATPEGTRAMMERMHSGQGWWGARDAA
jgi:hypothetical protein